MTEEKKTKKVAAPKEKKAAKETKPKEAKSSKEIRARLFDVIRSPLITEKSTAASEFNKVVFKVCSTASKKEIKDAVETLFGVKVIGVNTSNTKGKTKIFRGRYGQRQGFKKAIVSLAEGEKIDVMAGV